MSLAQLHSRALLGLDAPLVTVEVHLVNGLPSFTLVGLADVEVREARERVRSAIVNSGLEFPTNQRITVNLAPADLPKDSGRFDLPIALGILAAAGQLDLQGMQGFEFAGELSLSGALRPVRGALPAALALHHQARQTGQAVQLVLPPDSAEEAALVPGCTVYRARHLLDVVQQFRHQGSDACAAELAEASGWQRLEPAGAASALTSPYPDMADVKGQAGVRRALEVAAAGQHHVLMVGTPGAGKSMLAQRFPGLLPALDVDEALESAAMASLAGRFSPVQWRVRPFRSPHHTASAVALVGGGSPPRPGEISQAHHGVLFLDELPEFPRTALEALREPLETGEIHVARAARTAQFPARFQLIAAMNPCPCGFFGSADRQCRCTPDQIARYQGKLSGPLLDRIDLCIEVPTLPPHELLAFPGHNGNAHAPRSESSAEMALRVAQARQWALARQGKTNHLLHGQELETHAALDADGAAFLHHAARKLQWSARSMHRVLRVARTIADLAQSTSITRAHLAEAAQYRRALPGKAQP